jgi:hypothetical protein
VASRSGSVETQERKKKSQSLAAVRIKFTQVFAPDRWVVDYVGLDADFRAAGNERVADAVAFWRSETREGRSGALSL